MMKRMSSMDYVPDQGSLVAGIPIAGDRLEGLEGEGNSVRTDFTWRHVEIDDPRERLQARHDRAAQMKEHAVAALGHYRADATLADKKVIPDGRKLFTCFTDKLQTVVSLEADNNNPNEVAS